MIEILNYLPKSPYEFFGILGLSLHLYGYWLYSWSVFQEWIKPHTLTWFMWFAGGVVEYATYQAIPGAHWSSNALPLACAIGLGFITLAIIVAQVRNWIHKTQYQYESPEKKDYVLFGFDAASGWFWWTGVWSAALANIVAVTTSIFTFVPLWRTIYRDPQTEHYLPWFIWTSAYAAMFLAVLGGPGSSEWELYVYPSSYFVFHAIVVWLCLKKATRTETI